MPTRKIVGKVTPEKANMYCEIGTIKTNRVSYGVTRKVNTKDKKLVKRRDKTITQTPEGRDILLRCTAPRCPLKDDDIEEVKIVCPEPLPIECSFQSNNKCGQQGHH